MRDSEISSRLDKILIYKELKMRCEEDVSLAAVLALVHSIGEDAISLSKAIILNMPEYTLHDENHIYNMLYLAGKIIPQNVMSNLSTPDLMMIILSVFLHDIGMSPNKELVQAWKGQLEKEDEEKYKDEIYKFQRYRKTFVQEIDEIEIYHQNGEDSKAQLIEDQIITNYIRTTHAERARKMIAERWEGKIKFLDTDLTADLAEICFSHNESHMALLNMETIKLCAEDTYLCLPFVAVILRLTDIIDFDAKRTPTILFSHLTIKNPVSLKEWVKHLSVTAWSFGRETITFATQCTHPAIEAAIRGFCDQIDEELRNCTLVLTNLNSDIVDVNLYKIKLPAYVNRDKICAKKDIVTGKPIYRYHDTKFTLNKKQVIDLLMGTKLYGKPEVALRELIQNSIDACLFREKLCEYWGDSYIPDICVSYKQENGYDYLIVEDNGIGMNQHIIDNFYTNIGQSYYTSSEFFDLMAGTQKTYKPISRFGIGILACFMVCDSMEVETKRMTGPYQTDEAIKISVEGYDSLFVISEGKRRMPGTKTVLKLRQVHPWQRMSEEEFIECVKDIVPLPPFKIKVNTKNVEDICTPDRFEKLDFSLKDDYTWKEDENIRVIKINLNDKEKGFRGRAEIAYISNLAGDILESFVITEKKVRVDNEDYTLSANITYGDNYIEKNVTSLEVNEEGDVETKNNFHQIYKSSASFSLHGIDVPCNMFSDYSNLGQKAILHFPFPIRFRLDIGAPNDLNLNSARTQIIYDEVWANFEKMFTETVCDKIKENVRKEDWEQMKRVFVKRPKNEVFDQVANIKI